MKEPTQMSNGALGEDLERGLLRDLERQRLDRIQLLRAHKRVELQVSLTARPGNSSDRSGVVFQGQTADISAGGTKAFFSAPLLPGDVYRITFDDQQLGLPMIFARCIRCLLIREDHFEIGLQFFTKIAVGEKAAPDSDDLLA
jgi:c-di-GMP-binding flagellar brake protein YcgR